jgi:hypothetical protein
MSLRVAAAIFGGCESTIILWRCRFSTIGCLADRNNTLSSAQPPNDSIAITTMKSIVLMQNLIAISFASIFRRSRAESSAFLV